MGIEQNLGRRDNRLAICIFFVFFSIYLLTGSRVLHVDADEGINFATVENIAKFSRFDVEQLASISKSSEWEFGVDGKHYSKYGLMQSVLPVPLYEVATRIPNVGNADVVLLFCTIVTALTTVIVFLSARTLQYSVGSSIFASLIFGLATYAWAYSKRFLGEPTSSLLLITFIYWLLRFEHNRRQSYLVLAGIFMGLAFAFKVSNVIVLPAGLVFIAYTIRDNKQRLRCLLSLSAPFAFFVVLVGIYNYVRFGNPWTTGYGPHEGFSIPLLYGLWGLLLSPGRSFFLYSPILILSLFGFGVLLKKHRGAAILLGLSVTMQILLYAKWWIWWGGWSWGPRFLVPLAPVMTLWLLPIIDKSRRGKRRETVLFGLFLVISLIVQIVGVVVDHSWYLRDQSIIDPDVHGITVSDWHFSPLLNQLRYIDLAHLDFIWIYNNNRSIPIEIDYTSFTLNVSLICIAVLAAFAVAKYPRYVAKLQFFTLLTSLLVIATIFVSGITLARAYEHEPTDYKALLSEINSTETKPDVVIFSDFLRNDDFLNFNKSSVFVLGWGEEPTPSPALQRRLDEVARRAEDSKTAIGTILHITPNKPMDPNNGIESFLNQHFFIAETKWFGNTRLVKYAAPKVEARQSNTKEIQLTKNIAGLFELQSAQVIQPESSLGKGAGKDIFITLDWKSLAPTKEKYTVFVQLLSPEGKVVAQRDQMPMGNILPTDKWLPGQVIGDNYEIGLNGELPAGAYPLIAGMYNLADGKRLPLVSPSGEAAGDFVQLTTIDINP